MRVNLREIAARAGDNPGKPLWDALGDLSTLEVGPNYVLVATYVAPEKIGSIYVSDRRMEEDRFQGKIGLVVKKGPCAFEDVGNTKFGGFNPQVGDWVIYRPSDAIECFVRDRRKVNEGTACRFVEDVVIKGYTTNPDQVY